jgi:hypothetical protein
MDSGERKIHTKLAIGGVIMLIVMAAWILLHG